jgi:Protein of unknown function (DUF2630)
MSDESIAAQIDRLVSEEKDLRRREQQDRENEESLEADQERLRAVEVELDRCWDLLRQRRAKEEFGQDPDDAETRSPGTVENYKQ